MSYESIDNMKVLVLDEYADQYRDLLENLGLPIDYAAGLEAISGTYEVLLAQPDLAAEYLLQTDKVRWIQSTWAGITPMLAALRQRSGVMVFLTHGRIRQAALPDSCALRWLGGASFSLVNSCAQSVHEVPAD